MRRDWFRPKKLIVVLTTLLLPAQFVLAQQSTSSQGSGREADPTASSGATESQPQRLPDSPGSLRFQIVAANQQTSAQPSSETSPQNSKPEEQQPVGTAAAEAIISGGTAASAPAGAAIAPAKQRQVRSILIRMGAVLGAGAAVGTVYALSTASPAKPPGAH